MIVVNGDLALIERSSLKQQRDKLQWLYQYFAVSILSLQVSIHRYITYMLGLNMGYYTADKVKTNTGFILGVCDNAQNHISILTT